VRTIRQRGFTLAELIIGIGVLSLVLAASWGNIQSLLRQQRLTGATNRITTHLRLARERSVAEGNNYIVTFRVPTNDYVVWDDEGSDAILGPGETRTEFAMPEGVVLDSANFAAANRVIFRADGTTNATGALRIRNGENSRSIRVLASTGKVTVTSP